MVTVQSTIKENLIKEQVEINKIQDTAQKQKRQISLDAKGYLIDAIMASPEITRHVKNFSDYEKQEIQDEVISDCNCKALLRLSENYLG